MEANVTQGRGQRKKKTYETLLHIALQVLQASVQKLLLVLGNLTNGVDSLDTLRAELDLAGEELDALVLVKRALNKRGLNNAGLAVLCLEQALGHTGASHGHGESGGTSTVLCFYDFITAKLHALDVLVEFGAFEVLAGLGKKGHDSGAGVAADDDDVFACRVAGLDAADEAGGADDVEGGDAEEAFGVVDVFRFEDGGRDGDGGVDLGCG